VYLVETSFDLADFDQKFQQSKKELNRIGEVIATFPKADGNGVNFTILYATKSDLYGILHQAMRAGQAAAEATGKQVDFSIRVEGSLEKSVCDALADPLMHLVRNAVDHGIETSGHIIIDGDERRITVTDDGRGIDPAILDEIFEPGFSTASVSELSGRGVGLDVVKNAVEELGGSIRVSSELGKGASFELTLPNSGF
jgi:two-component system chemotaxis sensor kinase CheA